MSKLSWFKHYNTAGIGSSFEILRSEGDHETMACFWLLLELVSRHESESSRGLIKIPQRLLHQYWSVRAQKATRIIAKMTAVMFDTLEIQSLEQSYQVLVRNWLELQETRGGKRFSKADQKIDQSPGEVRSKRLEVRSKKVRSKIQKEEIIHSEVAKAPEFDFEIIFASYPKRSGDTGRSGGMRQLVSKVKSQQSFDDALAAVNNYREHCDLNGKTGTGYVKQFSTFFGRDNAWLEFVNHSPQASPSPKSSFNRAEARTQANRSAAESYLKKLEDKQNET